jgi:hypothetical protein
MGLACSGLVRAGDRGHVRAAAGDPAWAEAVRHLSVTGK